MRILHIDIDTLRPDHMSCYGYARQTTPNLDAIADEGVRFDRMYCSDAPCLPSRAALITGRFGIHTGAVGHGGTAADRRLSGVGRDFVDWQDTENFTHVFRRAGLHTVSISTFAERHSAYWHHAGFNEVHDVGGRGVESGEAVVPVALDWLAQKGARDGWYMHLHLWDPHTPYRTPEDFPNPFADSPLPGWITPEVFAAHLGKTGPHGAREINMYTDAASLRYPKHPGAILRHEDLRQVIDGYDCGVYYADMLLGQVFDALRRLGVWEETAVIVSSDHGENLGELGLYAEHATADEPTCHIPMLIRWPGAMRGICDDGLHYQLDLVPTVAELLGVAPSARWDGQSFAPALQTGEDCGRPWLVLSQMAHVCQRSVRFGDWLYIRTIHDGFHLFDQEMLFNLAEDRHEQHDLKATRPDICGEAARLLLAWQEEQMQASGSDVDPMWTVVREGGPYHTWGHLESYCRRLEATGRGEGARRLMQRHAGTKPGG